MTAYSFDSTIRGEVFAILGPSLIDATERRALVWLATQNEHELIADLDWDGPPEVFLVRLLDRLEESHDPSGMLVSLLHSVKGRLDAEAGGRAGRLEKRLSARLTELQSPATDPVLTSEAAHFRVFISSPSDVADERAVGAQVVERLAYDPLVRGWLTTEVVAWDSPVPAPLIAGVAPQQSIDSANLTPESCDVVLVILWSRIGTRNTQIVDGNEISESGTEQEYRRAVASFKSSGSPTVIVYNRAEPAWVELGAPDLLERQSQWEAVRSFVDTLTGADGAAMTGVNFYSSTDEFRSLVESHLRELVRRRYGGMRITNKGTSEQESLPQALISTPYPGLRAFDVGDSVVFFGRGHEVDALVQRLAAADGRFVAIVGASGSGKSSLVSAGLLPRLQHDAIVGSRRWRVVRTTPDKFGLGNPFVSLGVAVEGDRFDGGSQKKPWRTGELAARVSAAERQGEHDGTLLIVDQFEELFTSVDPTMVDAYIDQILTLTSAGKSRVIITIRSDFYDRCVEYPALASALRRGSFPLSAPGLGSLYQMIVRPAEAAGIEIERGLSERILSDTGVDTGALALMAFTLSELFAAAAGGALRHELYDQLGGVRGAVGARAANTFDELDSEAQDQMAFIFTQLITVNEDGAPTRQRGRPAKWSGDTEAQSRFLNSFIDARLLVTGQDADGQATIEVAHEALFHSWPRLAEWIDEARDDLRVLREVERAAVEWRRQDFDKSYLWPEERMLAARNAVGRLGLANVDAAVADAIADFLVPEAHRLIAELVDPVTSHLRRAWIGERLAELGDTRIGVGNKNGVPAIEWCSVTGGIVRLDGVSDNFEVDDFLLSKYPITAEQYESFVAAEDGYHSLDWWNGMPRRAVPPEAFRRLPNHPMENVSWYEAVAFCRWLSHRVGREVRLPTEMEWQIAANGGVSSRLVPWGSEWYDDRANTLESGLGRTVAVGMYPAGAAVCGALDMAGNVWEWCLNESANPRSIEIIEADQRAVRGGCWYHEAGFCVTSFRNEAWDYAAPRTQLRGFRVMTPLSAS